MKEILYNRKKDGIWEIMVHTYNIYDDYMTHYSRAYGRVFQNKYILTSENSKHYKIREE